MIDQVSASRQSSDLTMIDGGVFSGEEFSINHPIKHPLNTHGLWLSVSEISDLSGIAKQNVQKAINSRCWRGYDLLIKVDTGTRSRGGKTFKVHVDSLPSDLREAWYLSHGIALHEKVDPDTGEARLVPEASVERDDRLEHRLRIARWRHDVIKPALSQTPRTREREEAILELAAVERLLPNGKRKAISRAQIHRWVSAFQKEGLAGLMPKENRSKGVRRTIVTRVWDGFFDGHIDLKAQTAVSEEIVGYIRSLWASGERGKNAIAEKATTRLIEISRGLGVIAFERLPLGQPVQNGGPGSQFSVCHVNTGRAEEERKYSVIAVKRQDNAVFQDSHMPHIMRDYSSYKPRDIVVGDVHPTDVMMHRPDGSEVYPKAISWLDVATNEIHMTFVLMEKGEGVKREHVAMAFEAMAVEWGLPRMLYLDNGAEYSWDAMIGGFTELSKLTNGSFTIADLDDDGGVHDRVTGSREAIIRSLAYNAKGKPKIEGAFGNIEKVQFALMPGWTAGERMRKKTHTKGKAPKPFPGDARDFLAAASTMLEWYHKRPQHGRLDGKSPNEALRRFVDKGWGKTVLSNPDVLKLAFSEEVERTPKSGRVSIKNRFNDVSHYYADELLNVAGSVIVRVPAYKPEVVFCFEGERFLCTARPERAFGILDRAGAEELGRRKKVFLREIAEMSKHCALLDLVSETERHNKLLPDAPEVPVAAVVDTGMLDRLARIEAEERKALSTKAEQKPRPWDQWGVQQQENEHVKNVEYLEEDDDGAE